jgi:hypothetical protein
VLPTRPVPPRRRRLWGLGDSLHCSIIGMCPATEELRRVHRKLGLAAPDTSDHALHGIAVGLVGREGEPDAKLPNKALDDRHSGASTRCATPPPCTHSGARRWRPAMSRTPPGRCSSIRRLTTQEREIAERRGLAATEAALMPLTAPSCGTVPTLVLHVGGRCGQTAALRDTAGRIGVAGLVHHDAEAGTAQLPGWSGGPTSSSSRCIASATTRRSA